MYVDRSLEMERLPVALQRYSNLKLSAAAL